MAEPVRRGLRPARCRGLTSPDPVRTRYGPDGPPEPRPRARNPGQAAGQTSGKTPAPGFTPENSSRRNRSRKRPTGISRWIEAKKVLELSLRESLQLGHNSIHRPRDDSGLHLGSPRIAFSDSRRSHS